MKYAFVILGLIILSMYAIIDYQYDANINKDLTETVLRGDISAIRQSIGFLENRHTVPLDYPYVWPLHPDDYDHNTSGFGLRNTPSGIYTGGSLTSNHKGFDLTGVWHSRVIAIADGEVIDNYYPPGNGWRGHPIYGGMIRIKHADGRYSVYAHLSATYVNETDKRFVKQGQVIGRTGRTGLADGEHLHIEIWENGAPIQVLKYLETPE
jgi:murein DD-endopeptidase MepM/ murein hydrolase activator NlpD